MQLQLKNEHRWDLAPYEAQQVQKDLQLHVNETAAADAPRTIAGVQIAHSRFSDMLTVAIAVVDTQDMSVVAQSVVEHQTKFPYIPGLLSFRECPAILEAVERLDRLPDMFVVDGPGIAHPHGLGVASHLGVLLDVPTIGCSRSSLVGSYVEPEVSAGSQTTLVWQGEIIGTVYRSKNRVAPLFISVGHRVTRAQAHDIVVSCCQGYRLPEPTRHAYAALTSAKSGAKGAPSGARRASEAV